VSQQWEEYSVGSLCMYGNSPAKVLHSAGKPNERFIEYVGTSGKNFEWVTTEDLSSLSPNDLHSYLTQALLMVAKLAQESRDAAKVGDAS
jgi:hypothetical protein